MGNVLALSSSQVAWSTRKKVTTLPNPGSFDELHKKCKEVFPQQMEGVKLIINRPISSHLQVSHIIHMSTAAQSCYHFNAKYVGNDQPSTKESFPTLIGDLDSNGSLNAQVLCLLAERIRSKAVFQTYHSKFHTWQIDGEYRGDDCTVSVTLGNPDLLNESVILVSHFLQSVTPRLVLGGELVYHQRLGEEGAIVTLAGKYSAPDWVATLNIGYGGAHASYYHNASEQIKIGVEFEANTRLQETSFAFGYHLNIPKANMVFKGVVKDQLLLCRSMVREMNVVGPVDKQFGAGMAGEVCSKACFRVIEIILQREHGEKQAESAGFSAKQIHSKAPYSLDVALPYVMAQAVDFHKPLFRSDGDSSMSDDVVG